MSVYRCQAQGQLVPPPSYSDQGRDEREKRGHGWEDAPPHTEVRHCEILAEGVAWQALMGKSVTVNDESTKEVEGWVAWARSLLRGGPGEDGTVDGCWLAQTSWRNVQAGRIE